MGKRGHHPVAPTHGFNDPSHGRSIYKELVGGKLRNHAKITCVGCKKADVISMKSILPEQVITKKFQQKGWRLKPDTCPECFENERTRISTALIEAAKTGDAATAKTTAKSLLLSTMTSSIFTGGGHAEDKAEDKPVEEPVETPKVQAKENTVNDTKTTSPTPNLKAQARVLRLLVEHFNEEECVYENGYSDQRIAAETGMAVKAVADARRGAFGELKEPPEFQEIRDEIKLIDMQITELVDDYKDLGTQITSLSDMQGKLVARLNNLAHKLPV